jgi:hypothetical protein
MALLSNRVTVAPVPRPLTTASHTSFGLCPQGETTPSPVTTMRR